MTEHVGVREFKARLSHYLARVSRGERFTVTARGKPVAEVGPSIPDDLPDHLRKLVEAGLMDGRGGPIRDLPDPIPLLPGDKTMVDYVREQRR
jgi:prevent-host-death family protein